MPVPSAVISVAISGERDQLVEARPLDVQDLALERQDRLELAVAALLRRAAGRIALDQIELAYGRVASPGSRRACRASPKPIEHALAPRHLARLARRLARARRVDDLDGDGARVAAAARGGTHQLLGHDLLDHRPHLRGDELVLGLRRELGLRHLDRQHAGEPLAHVVASGLHLRLLGDLVLLDVLVERAGHRRAQAGQVGAAVPLRDVVGEAAASAPGRSRSTASRPRP